MATQEPEWITKVRGVMDQAGIPEYIWRPISIMEGNNPGGVANTSKEYSVGVFQINMLAHSNVYGSEEELKDPETNAKAIIQEWTKGRKGHSQGVLTEALKLPKEDQAAYVWRYGSRPAWSTEKEEAISLLSSKYLGGGSGSGSGGSGIDRLKEGYSPDQYHNEIINNTMGYQGTTNPLPEEVPGVSLPWWGTIARLVVYLVLGVLAFIAFRDLFTSSTGKEAA